ncbi:MAG: hypothetical protein MN733_16285 [Nitrososphaera sp.]|nr:hypothetical protein [Nitrososphaera sp.]MCI0705855.1 hypothetical protein [Ignavibacteriota bacterium]
MAAQKTGTVTYRHDLSPYLSLFRVMPEAGSKFPHYQGGQYVALRRDNCRLTKRVIHKDGSIEYVPDLDAQGNLKRGPVAHSYSIASAPFETEQNGYLEFYVILELQETGEPGRLTESLFNLDPKGDNQLTYFEKITGDFTLESRARDAKNVVMVGTGTGLAPFASMLKQLHHEASNGKAHDMRFTLFHANRIYSELAYHNDLIKIEAEQKIDFVYVPSVSRPTEQDYKNSKIGKGRANNALRHVFDMPLKEEQELRAAQAQGKDVEEVKAFLERTVKPVLPSHVSKKSLLERMDPSSTVILTCGNPLSMADIEFIAKTNNIRFEKEDW